MYSLTLVSSLQQFSSFLMFFLRLANTYFQVPVVCSFRDTSGNHIGSHSLFDMFINDLPTNTTPGIKLFADDCVLYCPINSVRDHFALQRGLDQLEKWAYTWQMKFAPTKCFVMSITLKNSPSQFSYSLCNAQLDGAFHQKYFGV